MAPDPTGPTGQFVTEDGIEWYRIERYDFLDPFLVNVVTPTDQWMYVSSSGALTAGRRSAEGALFPYETDDRLHRSAGRIGPLTVLRVGDHVWEPFAPHVPHGVVQRSLAKTTVGDRLRFTERHPRLGLTFTYTWTSTDRFGFIRSCEIIADPGTGPVQVEVLDGLNDLLPAGVDLATQTTRSTLVDAYRRAELDQPSGIAVFTLEALVSDKAAPAESLRATVAWSRGLPDPVIALSGKQVRSFRSGEDLQPEHLVTGRKGGFFVSAAVPVTDDTPLRWFIATDVGLDHGDLARLRTGLGSGDTDRAAIDAAIASAHDDLMDIVAGADSLQETADHTATVHHFANVLFNVMRGGVFLDDHRVAVADFARFIAERNHPAATRFGPLAERLGAVIEISGLKEAVAGDPDLERLAEEYLPLSFSRRHGDPSRPWNAFSISPGTGYEGNWRDIFQNWDALLHSYPHYIGSVIAKFLNASTVDGFNPYRITDRGIEWEVPGEGAWGNYGYWGDHQIAYLHRLLDVSERFFPGVLASELGRPRFSYADVPYRIVPYPDLVDDPRNTILFDTARREDIDLRVGEIGADGRLVFDDGRDVLHVSLAEKLLVPALSKLSNLVAGGGIWMNTQRPEWNDANNALVGNGASMVTLLHLRDYLDLLDRLLHSAATSGVLIGERVTIWIGEIQAAFQHHRAILDDARATPRARRSLLDALGTAFSEYRAAAYEAGTGPPTDVAVVDLTAFLALAREFLDHSAAAAHRPDGLITAYTLMHLAPGTATVEPLPEMLEGQVAHLSGTRPATDEVLRIIDTMFDSALYRPDQHSFLLYPDRRPPAFIHKNVVSPEAIGPYATRLLDADQEILYRDSGGVVRFGAWCTSAVELAAALEDIDLSIGAPGPTERDEILDLYETVFGHAAFTGRSGSMYRYEGLGSIYWHMVSKLLLAIGEKVTRAANDGEDPAALTQLAERYRRVRGGLGFAKPVSEQGTFPTDPHSHTPAHTGAQQPGMTGQVKEGVLLRWAELGVHVGNGRVRFRPLLLDRSEFLTDERPWSPLGDKESLAAGTLGFTYCGTPVVYRLVDGASWATIRWSDGTETTGTDQLGFDESQALFARQGTITRIDVGVSADTLL